MQRVERTDDRATLQRKHSGHPRLGCRAADLGHPWEVQPEYFTVKEEQCAQCLAVAACRQLLLDHKVLQEALHLGTS